MFIEMFIAQIGAMPSYNLIQYDGMFGFLCAWGCLNHKGKLCDIRLFCASCESIYM